ncbi:MAG: alpha/beta hydrolase [Thermoflexaceae bacterium]|nr:alpha/beta hydrolase [Thermoflexaceae bacterium]
MGILKIGIACAGALLAGGAAETVYFYQRTMIRQNANMERTIKMAGTDWSQYSEILAERKAFMLEQPHEDVYQTSFDGLKLHATYFPPIKEWNGKKRVVICFHGYTSQGLADFTGLTDYYFRNGFAMLHPDARAHGQSEGKYIGFGCLDKHDALKWIDWIIEKCGEDVEIILHGISMGASTALMAGGMELAPQVKGIISDCGFTSPKEVFTHVLHTMYHLPSFPVMQGAEIMNRKLAGYGMDECNAKREVTKAKVPILFIHGSKDTFVPTRMCQEIYDCCASPKKMLIVEGAAHGESYFKDMKAYENALDEFIGNL